MSTDGESEQEIDEENILATLETDEEHTDESYNPAFEQLLKDHGDQAQVYSILHQMMHIKYKNLYDKCNIPLIILTAVIGFVTGIQLHYEYGNLILGGASVIVSIMKSIISYMKLSERHENHRICSLQFAQISNEIRTELSLQHNQRQPARIMLDVIKVKYKNLIEVAQLIDNDVIQRFRMKYIRDEEKCEIALPPLFSTIPGIKILGADSDAEHLQQLEKNLNRYIEEKRFERERVKSQLQHLSALRAIKEKYRVPERNKEEDTKEAKESKSSRESMGSRSVRPPLTRPSSLPTDSHPTYPRSTDPLSSSLSVITETNEPQESDDVSLEVSE